MMCQKFSLKVINVITSTGTSHRYGFKNVIHYMWLKRSVLLCSIDLTTFLIKYLYLLDTYNIESRSLKCTESFT